jgi:dihydroorotase
METVFKGMTVFRQGTVTNKDILVIDGKFADFSRFRERDPFRKIYECNDCYAFPGLVDVHVHLREPGFFIRKR